jgi:hypothetical protein
MADAAAKLGSVLSPLLDASTKSVNNHTTVSSQEVLQAMARIEARLDILEKLLSEKRKPTAARSEKKTAEATTDAPKEAPAAAPENFPVNKLFYFRKQFTTDAAYRAKYVSPALQEQLDKEATIAAKTGQQKLLAQATHCWNYFKKHDQTTANAIETEYNAAKAAHEAANKPAQQTAEPRTPPNETNA